MTGRIRVAVIGGGKNGEHGVSLASAAAVADALDPTSYDVVRLTIDPSGIWRDRTGDPVGLSRAVSVLGSCGVVVPMVHGPHGEDGTLAALCDLVGVPHVGSGVRAGALAMDKWATKLVAQSLGIATAPGVLLTAETARDYHWTHPVVVKPAESGSSLGVALVRAPCELRAALDEAFTLGVRVLVEDRVEGREIDLAVLGTAGSMRVVSPALEVVGDGLFDFDTKYDGTADLRLATDLARADLEALEGAALAMYDALGCGGVARVDFFLTETGPVLNEVNTTPGFTDQSQVPRMFAAAGLPYAELLDALVNDALGHR